MSFLNSSHSTFTLTKLPSHITKAHVLSLLHDNDRMILINPIVTAHQRLPDASSTAFFSSEPASLKPSANEPPIPVFSVTEVMAGPGEGSGSWRGGWAKRFVPESLSYETSMQNKEDGLLSITHAPMGVHSTTTWVVKEENGVVVLDERGVVTSNRMLMGFIKTTLQESHDKLVRDFVATLEREWAKSEEGKIEEGQKTLS